MFLALAAAILPAVGAADVALVREDIPNELVSVLVAVDE
jgi:hypothetical protein